MSKYQSQYTGKQIDEAVANQKVMAEQIEKNHQIAIRNSKQIENLKQGTADQFETDSSVAYVKDVPENALPYAEIKKIGGMTYKDGNTLKSAKVTAVESVGINKFGGNSTENPQYYGDYYVETSGVLSGNANYNCFVIPIIGGKTYFIWSSAASLPCPILHFLDDNSLLQVNTALYGKPSGAIAAPSGAKYMRIAITKNSTADVCINVSSEAYNGKYFPYVHHTLPIPEAVRPANCINENVYDFIEWAEDGSVVFLKAVNSLAIAIDDITRAGHTEYANVDYYRVPKPADAFDYDGYTNKYICDWEFGGTPWDDANNIGKTSGGAEPNYYWFGFAKGTTLEDAKQALGGKKIVYQLATPEITDISDLISSDNLIEVEGGGTLTFKNEYNYAVPSEVEYQVEV
jgi:hypothetical protein